MLTRLTKIDRRLTITGLVLLASSLLLVVGLASIFLALGDDVDLPNEGSLEDILSEHREGQAFPVPLDRNYSPPVRIAIPSIGIDAPVNTMGLDSQSYPEVPDTGNDVAWYDFSNPPGAGGNAVFSGHVDWFYWGQPGEGVFYHLRELKVGDDIWVALEDGTELHYTVTGNVAVQYEDPNVVKVMDPTAKEVITLITCGGTWLRDFSNPNGGNYSHRVVVRAERVLDLAFGEAPGG